MKTPQYPYGFEVYSHSKIVPTPAPIRVRWRIAVSAKTVQPAVHPSSSRTDHPAAPTESEITVQLTADQQVALSISGQDAYGNAVDVTGAITWVSSDDSIITVTADESDSSKATAVAVGPVGTASVTVHNDFDDDGTPDFQGSVAIDVVGGQVTEIVISEGEVSNKPAGPDGGEPPVVDNTLPGEQPGIDNSLPGEQPGIDNSLPGEQPGVDNELPGAQPGGPGIDNELPGEQPGIDNSLPDGPPPVVDNELPEGPTPRRR